MRSDPPADPVLRLETGASAPGESRARDRQQPGGLSVKLLVLTIFFVMLAEILIYVPSVANFRRNWLTDRIAAAQIATLVVDAAADEPVSEDLAARLLNGVGARAIAVRGGGTRRLLALDDMPPAVERMTDLRTAEWPQLIMGAARTLFYPAVLPIRVVGQGMNGADFVEIVIDEQPLRAAMIAFSRTILLTSLLISGITAGLVFFALQWVIVRPVQRIARNMTAFASDPENASRVIAPSGRRDEIGIAEQALASMEGALAGELRQKRRLAELGLAVSKINHELRNLLTTAQLLGDRLQHVSDPLAQRVAPRLLATLGRAIAFCEATLAYGRASEREPHREPVALGRVVAELADLAGLAPGRAVAIDDRCPADLVVLADHDQLTRILANLIRNAVQAIGAAGTPAPVVAIEAAREGALVRIAVTDNGPGLPEQARAHLFQAFSGSARAGGTGLGLVVASELVRLHGGELRHVEVPVGARFEFTIPDRPPA